MPAPPGVLGFTGQLVTSGAAVVASAIGDAVTDTYTAADSGRPAGFIALLAVGAVLLWAVAATLEG